MSQLPAAGDAVVEPRKVTEYLLSADHPTGSSKARYFTGYGFSVDRWSELADALREHGRSSAVVETETTAYGQKFVLEGELQAPDGRRPRIRAVWVIEADEQAPRFVTAYPAEPR